jgi:TrmH family RNA methyltransferase
LNKPLRIQSVNNELFRQLRSLKSSRSIRELKICAVHGLRFALDLLKRNRIQVKYVAYTETMNATLPTSLVSDQSIRLLELDAALYREIDEFGTHEPIFFCELPVIAEVDGAAECTVSSVLLPFQNPDNLGAAIRSAAAFGVRVMITEESAFPYHPKSIRASAGAVFDCEMIAIGKMSDFKPSHTQTIVLDASGPDISEIDVVQNFVLIPGIEGPGIPKSMADYRSVSIPMRGPIESLNASVAVGIALYVLTNKNV